MGILDVDHPDVLKFIREKDTPGSLENFNVSIRVTDEFMNIVLYQADHPKFKEYKELFDELCQRAWSSAEPGILFGDRIERDNKVPHLYKLNATNP